MDTPLLVRRQEVQRLLRVSVGFRAHYGFYRTGVDWRTVNQQAFTEVAHPLVILIQRLTTGQGTPWDQLVNVGVAGVIGDVLIFQTRPGRAGDDFARLGLNIAEADFLFLFIRRQMRVVTAGKFTQRCPGFHGHVAVGFRGQGQDHLCRINRGVQHWLTFGRAVRFGVVELTQQVHFGLGVPANPFPAVTDFFHQRADRGKALVGCRIVTFNRNDVRRRYARDQVTFAFFPVLHVQRLRQFGSGVVLDGQRHYVSLFAEVPHADFGEFLRDIFVDIPVAFRFPGRVNGGRQRMNKRMHIRGIHVVFFIPGGGWQHDVGIQAGAGETEVQGHHQVQLAVETVVFPLHLFRLHAALLAEIFTLDTVFGTEQVFQHVLVAFTGRTQQV